MRRRFFGRTLAAGILALTATTIGSHASEPLDTTVLEFESLNFKSGKNEPFLRMDDTIANVFFFVTVDCPISNFYSPEFRRVAEKFSQHSIRFALIYPDPDLQPKQIKQHLVEFQLGTFNAYADPEQRWTRAVGATVTPECAVVLPDRSRLYLGRIDNRYADFGKRRRVATEHELRDVLAALVAGQIPNPTKTKAVGCYIPPPSDLSEN